MATYRYNTPYYNIPVAIQGDTLSGQLQQKIFNIIENQLIAAMSDKKSVVFSDGAYNLLSNGGVYDVYLNSNGVDPAVFGLLNGGLVNTNSTISWLNLSQGYMYYLYLQWKDTTYVFPDDFSIVSFTSPQTDDTQYLLMATVDYTGLTPVLNTTPTGKVYSENIKTHLLDPTDPHGTTWYQSYLNVLKSLTITITDNSVTTSAVVINDQRAGTYADIESKKNLRLKNQYSTVNLSDVSNPILNTVNQTLIGAINEIRGLILAHASNTSNPHSTTITSLGVTYTASQVNAAVAKAHTQNTDTYLNQGGSYQVTAAETRSHLDNASIHREINDGTTSSSLLWSSEKVKNTVPMVYVADIVSNGMTGVSVVVAGAFSIDFVDVIRLNVTQRNVTTLYRDAGDLNTVNVTVDAAHGWKSGEKVEFSGVSDGSISGEYTITVTGEFTFNITQLGVAGTYTGGTVAFKSSIGSLDVGDVSIGYYNEDATVIAPSEFKVYNSGVNWLPLRVFVKYVPN